MKYFEAEDIEKRETNYNAEGMSCEETLTVIDQYNEKKTRNIKEYKECEEMKETCHSLVRGYKRLDGYIID